MTTLAWCVQLVVFVFDFCESMLITDRIQITPFVVSFCLFKLANNREKMSHCAVGSSLGGVSCVGARVACEFSHCTMLDRLFVDAGVQKLE